MIPNEEGVVRGDDAFVEHGERGFQLRWTGGHPAERTFLGVSDESTFAVLERERGRVLRPSLGTPPPACEPEESRGADELTPVERRAGGAGGAVHPKKLSTPVTKEKPE